MIAGLARDALGVGLRPQHYMELRATRPKLDFLEVLADNYMADERALPRQRLTHARQGYALVSHSVSMNLLGAAPLDLDYLARLKSLIDDFGMLYATDHLCWTASGNAHHHELLPVPYDPELIDYAAARARFVQEYLGVPFGLENLSSYMSWRRDAISEWDFYGQVIARAGCYYMLDINNIYVSSQNHGFDAVRYLESVDWDRVLQVHVAGHQVDEVGVRRDTHDRAVCDEVWALYAQAWRMGGPFPTIVEWDEHIPPLETLLAQLERAVEVRR